VNRQSLPNRPGPKSDQASLPRGVSEPASAVLTALINAWPPADWRPVHVAIAVSGGPDSMALLRAVLELQSQYQGAGRLSVLHVNHRLRAAESDDDAAWLASQCAALGVPLTVLHGNAADRCQTMGDGVEAAARQERYQLLAEAAERLGVRYLATGHTRDDQVETVLFRLLRGSGLRGLRGIPRTRRLTPAVTLVRPLLDCSREALTSYLGALDQSYRTDRTNTDIRITRNRIRHELLPQLREAYNADIDAALLRLSAQSNDAQQLLETQAGKLLKQCAAESVRTPADASHAEQQQLSLAIEPFSQQPAILVCEALRLAWREAGLPEQAMTYHWWRRLTELAQDLHSGQILNLPGNVLATVSDDRLLLRW